MKHLPFTSSKVYAASTTEIRQPNFYETNQDLGSGKTLTIWTMLLRTDKTQYE